MIGLIEAWLNADSTLIQDIKWFDKSLGGLCLINNKWLKKLINYYKSTLSMRSTIQRGLQM